MGGRRSDSGDDGPHAVPGRHNKQRDPARDTSAVRALIARSEKAGSNISKIWAPSRNHVRAAPLPGMRSSSGVQRPGSNSLTGEKVASSTQGGRRQRQILYRGTPTKHCLQPPLSPLFHRLEGEPIRANAAAVQIFGHPPANHRLLHPGKPRFRLSEGRPAVVRRCRGQTHGRPVKGAPSCDRSRWTVSPIRGICPRSQPANNSGRQPPTVCLAKRDSHSRARNCVSGGSCK
jgi:hypothetical protein